jgi:Cof subfamily protein (haloacid dehalogenase superfamily)
MSQLTQPGFLCIDIDGTLTAVRDQVSKDVVRYLFKMKNAGYEIMFVTGRTVFWAMHLLKKLPFPFYLAALNGAYIVKMPENTLIQKHAISLSAIKKFSPFFKDHDVAVVLCSGPDHAEKSYLYIKHASKVILDHVEARKKALCENWYTIGDFSNVSISSVSACRIFCLTHTAKTLSIDIQEKTSFHAPMMRDSFNASFCVVQVTNKKATKGEALVSMKKKLGIKGAVIACGDDYNDLTMLEKADCKVVMNTAPSALLKLADVIAPSAKDDGLIFGIEEARKFYAARS